MISKHYDKILLGIALAFLLVVFGYAAFRPAPQSITEFVNIPALRGENTFEVSALAEPDLGVPRWKEPSAQSAGPDWLFDVFTPPVIYFNPRSETFTVLGVSAPPPSPWGVELVAIREDLYRVQLIGYGGRVGEYFITLENIETGEVVLAREGRQYPNLELTVRSFNIERIPVPHAGGTTVTQDVGRVLIYDERLDREITLRSELKKKEDVSTAYFRATNGLDQEFRARIGDSFTHNTFTYTVDQLNPPSRATVTRSGGDDKEPETKILVAQIVQGEGSSQQPAEDMPRGYDARPESDDATFDF